MSDLFKHVKHTLMFFLPTTASSLFGSGRTVSSTTLLDPFGGRPLRGTVLATFFVWEARKCSRRYSRCLGCPHLPNLATLVGVSLSPRELRKLINARSLKGSSGGCGATVISSLRCVRICMFLVKINSFHICKD